MPQSAPKQEQDNQDNRAYGTDPVKAPLLAMWPNRQTANQRYEDKYGENNHHQHLLAFLSLFHIA